MVWLHQSHNKNHLVSEVQFQAWPQGNSVERLEQERVRWSGEERPAPCQK